MATQIFFMFTPKTGEDEPILTTVVFFKWVGEKPPPMLILGGCNQFFFRDSFGLSPFLSWILFSCQGPCRPSCGKPCGRSGDQRRGQPRGAAGGLGGSGGFRGMGYRGKGLPQATQGPFSVVSYYTWRIIPGIVSS